MIFNKNKVVRLSLIIFTLTWSKIVPGQNDTIENFQPPDSPVEVIVSKVTGSINLDGRLDEVDWQNNRVTSDFFKREPRLAGGGENWLVD